MKKRAGGKITGDTRRPTIVYVLISQSGNTFSIYGVTRRVLKKECLQNGVKFTID